MYCSTSSLSSICASTCKIMIKTLHLWRSFSWVHSADLFSKKNLSIQPHDIQKKLLSSCKTLCFFWTKNFLVKLGGSWYCCSRNRPPRHLKKRTLSLRVPCKAGMIQGNSTFSHRMSPEDSPSKRYAITEELTAASPYTQKAILRGKKYAFFSTESSLFCPPLLNKGGGHWEEGHSFFFFLFNNISWRNFSRVISP